MNSGTTVIQTGKMPSIFSRLDIRKTRGEVNPAKFSEVQDT